jgi:hypothetical protein
MSFVIIPHLILLIIVRTSDVMGENFLRKEHKQDLS